MARITTLIFLIMLPIFGSAADWESYIDSSRVDEVSFSDERMLDYRNNPDYDYSSTTVPKPSNWQLFWQKILEGLFGDIDPRDVTDFWGIAKWFIIIIMLGFLVFLVLRSNGSRMRNRRDIGNSRVDILGYQGEESDLVDLIRQAEAEQNFQQAIRYLLIHLLHQLTDSNELKWDRSRTNREYIRLFMKQYDEDKLLFINRVFENSYYGELDISHTDYQRSKGYYEDLLKRKGGES